MQKKLGAVQIIMAIGGLTATLHGAKPTEADAVTTLLKDAGSQAAQIATDAAMLKTYAKQGKFDRAAHAGELDRMRSDVKAALATAEKLKDSRNDSAAWQTDVEEKILPLIAEISEDATKALDFLSSEHAPPLTPAEYKTYVESNSDLSKHLSGLISNLISYGSGVDKFEAAKRALELRIEASSK